MKIHIKLSMILLGLILLVSCSNNRDQIQGKTKLKVLATTGMIEEALLKTLGDSASIEVIVPVGVDPHSYQATQQDLTKLNEADIIVCNGFHLEGKMHGLLKNLAKQKTVIYMSAAVPQAKILQLDEYSQDPHIWLDVEIWQECIAYMSSNIVKENPELSNYVNTNLTQYLNDLDLVNDEAKELITSLPESKRYLITSHDAFGYFGKAFGLNVMGIKGFSTTTEASIKHVNELIEIITNNGVKTIFPESSVSTKDINTLVERCKERGAELKLGKELFSDSMGKKGTPAGTYCGMISHNINTLVNELK